MPARVGPACRGTPAELEADTWDQFGALVGLTLAIALALLLAGCAPTCRTSTCNTPGVGPDQPVKLLADSTTHSPFPQSHGGNSPGLTYGDTR